MILAKVILTSITLAGTVLLAKVQGCLEPDEKVIK
jgi:hypothetical protein